MKKMLMALALGVVLSSSVVAQVAVKDPWVRGTVQAQKATGAFMQLTATQDMRLVEARSPVANLVEVHEMAVVDNTMKMRAVPNGLALPAGQTVELKPGSYHVMLMDLKAPLSEGDVVPITLVLEGKDKKRETVEVKAPVRALGAPAMQHKH